MLPTSSDLVTDLPADFDVALQGVDTRLKALQPGTTLGDLAYSSATANTSTRLPIGTTGQVLAVSGGVPAWTTATDLVGTNPNLVINGNFTINQRAYVSAANLASGTYGFDRWKSNYTNTTLTYTSAPAGQSVTINSGGGLQQIIEQANVPAGTYVLSFTGTATGRIYNSGGTPPSYAASPITFAADGLANVVVEFTASGGTKTLSKVKLELSTSPTAFSYAGGTIQGELAACQRYFRNLNHGVFGVGNVTTAQFGVYHPSMRTTPTLAATGVITMTDMVAADFTQSAAQITAVSGTADGSRFQCGNFTGITAYRTYQLNSTNSITLSAEL